MRVAPGIVLFFALTAYGADQQQCKGNPAVVDNCFAVRGKLSSWNGNPTFRIWPVGTKRMLGVREEFDLPPELDKYLGHFDDVVFADFEVCPLTRLTPGRMQIVCVESAKNIRKTVRSSER